MFSLRNTLLGLVAASASVVSAEHLRVVWPSGTFSTIAPPGGTGEHGGYSGFAVLNDAGESLYDSSYPADHSPCYNTGDGRTFGLESDCWMSKYQFHCKSSFGGSPQNCEVLDADGNSLATGEGKKDTTSIGISIGIDASCVVEFDTKDDESCSPNTDFHVV